MASIFSTPDPARCKHYARFAAHLDRAHFDIIYWLLFTLVILMLCMASARYMSTMEAVVGDRPRSQSYNSKLRACMIYCSVFTVVSIVAVVLEVFVLMALQFCDGEDLMSIYWATWTMLQVGSLIAVFGILLHISHMMRGRKNPPWALALGTPVLVVAGLGHLISSAMNKRVKSVRARSLGGKQSIESVEALGSTDTAYPRSSGEEEKTQDERTSPYDARLVGFTPDGGPILQFKQSSPPPIPPGHAMILGSTTQGHVLIAMQADKIRFIKASIGEQTSPSMDPSRRLEPGPSVSRPYVTPVPTPETAIVEQEPPTPSPLPNDINSLPKASTTGSREAKQVIYPLTARQASSPNRAVYSDEPLSEADNPAALSLPTLSTSLQGQRFRQGSRRDSDLNRLTD